MGFGCYGRSAEQVQWDNGQSYDFAKIKERYENTKPIRGKRAKFDIRPHGERTRTWERIVKVNENEYYLTNDGYSWYEHPDNKSGRKNQPMMSFKLHDGIEYFSFHTPRATWREDKALYPLSMSPPSWYYMARFNVPRGLSFTNHRGRKYIVCNDKYYSAEKGEITFTRRVGENKWSPLVVHKEIVHVFDRTKSKALREQAKDFLNYAKIMSGLVESKYRWGHHIHTDHTYTWEDKLKLNEDGSVPEFWLEMVEHYKHRATRYWSGYDEKTMRRHILRDLYENGKPCVEVEVPLGQPCYDKFRSWYL
jgi:hypothetical protein